MRRTPAAAGFTLLELLVVMVLIGLMTALVAPRLAGTLSTTSARASVKRIAAALRYARNHAASEKAVYAALFHRVPPRVAVGKVDPSLGELPLMGELPAEDRGEALLIAPSVFELEVGVRIDSVASASGEPIDLDPAWIVFYPNGASSGGTVAVVDEKERRAALVVDSIMGTVVLEE